LITDHQTDIPAIEIYKKQGYKFTVDGVPLIYDYNRKPLRKEQKEALPHLLLDCRTYSFNFIESMMYIQRRMGRFVSKKHYWIAKKQLDTGVVTDEWLRNFAKVGFALVHQELLQNSLNMLRDTNRRILRLQNMDKNSPAYLEHFQFWEQLEINLKRLLIEQAREVSNYSLGTPIIAQIKSMIRSELILQERQRMIDSGMDIETTDYEILKNIFNVDIEKGKLNIRQIDKNNITNSDEITNKDPTQIQRNPEGDFHVGQELITNGEGTDSGNQPDMGSSSGDTNYGLPTSEQAQKELERINKAKRDFIQ
jgi:hypothetical protein